ncbi:MAG TPA: hypothetical protein VI776_15010 [Anaerolineales bacterium]|nr:hypothetical protein [Anaerolineales bacterium]
MNNIGYTQHNRWVRLLLVTGMLLGGFLSLVPPAKAQAIVFEDTIPAGQVLENDAILSGTDVTLAGEVVGDVLAVGTNITISGQVDGSLIAVGQHVSLASPVSGTTIVVSLDLLLEPAAQLARNLYFVGLSLQTQKDSWIGRDLVALALGATLNGEIARDTRAVLGPLEVIRLLIGSISGDDPQTVSRAIPAPAIAARPPVEQALQSGFAPPLRPLLPGIAGGALQQAQIDTARLQAWFLGVVRNLVTLLVFGLLGIWLFPRQLNQAAGLTHRRPWKATGIGLLALVIAFSLSLVAGLLFAMILAVGLWLSSVQLSSLALAVWAVGFSSLALVFSLSALFVAYGAKVIVAYLVGLLILERVFPRAAEQRWWPLLLGLALYVLLASIPGLGWVIAVLVTAIGLGAAWLLYRERGEMAASGVQTEIAGETAG